MLNEKAKKAVRAGRRGLFGQATAHQEIWPGYVPIQQWETADGKLRARGVILAYGTDAEHGEEFWYMYNVTNSGLNAWPFRAPANGDSMVFTVDTSSGAVTTYNACNPANSDGGTTERATFEASLASHTTADWTVTVDATSSDFTTAWNSSGTSHRFKLYQGAFDTSTGTMPGTAHVGYLVWNNTGSQHWYLFSTTGSGVVAFQPFGGPSTPSTVNAFRFVSLTSNLTNPLPKGDYVKHT